VKDNDNLTIERPTFVTVARLADRYKGHDVLVDALPFVRERVPDARWVVIGEGPLRPELEARVRARGLAASVSFLGAVSDEQRDGWLRRADLLAMPSRLPGPGRAGEGFGIVYLEAGAYGKPVVAGAVAGAPDAVLDGETGLLVDPTDPRAVADAIARLLLDRELARRLGAAGAARARALAWPLVAERVQALLLSQLEAPAVECGRRGRG
jgi:phosphatidylinositol alpha-1,6-mannosyltransferase